MKQETVTLDHGGGGRASRDLVESRFLPRFANPHLDRLDDGAVVEPPPGAIAMTTDSYVVDPIFFPGGDIGRLSICGTVNDLVAQGARPLFLTVGFILEEGLPLRDLEGVLVSMEEASHESGVSIVAGDTKVVPRGKADRIFINTAGVGHVPDGRDVSGHNAQPGDRIIVSGSVGDHGIVILAQREGLAFGTGLVSDVAPLNHMVEEAWSAAAGIHVMRDPTRGGMAASLNEIAAQSSVGIRLDEKSIPVKEAVSAACELLGFDPLYIANEGKMLVIVDPSDSEAALERIRKNRYGKEARIIGEVVADHRGRVFMDTQIGGTRIIDMPLGEQLPRIC